MQAIISEKFQKLAPYPVLPTGFLSIHSDSQWRFLITWDRPSEPRRDRLSQWSVGKKDEACCLHCPIFRLSVVLTIIYRALTMYQTLCQVVGRISPCVTVLKQALSLLWPAEKMLSWHTPPQRVEGCKRGLLHILRPGAPKLRPAPFPIT